MTEFTPPPLLAALIKAKQKDSSKPDADFHFSISKFEGIYFLLKYNSRDEYKENEPIYFELNADEETELKREYDGPPTEPYIGHNITKFKYP